MNKHEAISILLDYLSAGLVRTLEDAIAKEEREKCAERAWIALIKHGQPWNVRQDVTDAIKAGKKE